MGKPAKTTRSRRRATQPREAAAPIASARDVGRAFALLLPALLLTYFPVWRGGVLWDDDGHITKPALRSLHGLWQIWFQVGATQQYYPLTHTVFWIEHALWGDATLGYHLVNITLHAMSGALLYALLRRLRVPGAALAAAAFALHPMQVESVAWMTELKNTLAGAFYFGAALAWTAFDDSRSRRHYVLAVGLFLCGLLSKTVVATLPVALLAIVWWRRGRIDWRRDARPVVPMIVAGAAAGAITAFVERAYIGARGSEFAFNLVERALIAGRDVWFYLGSIAWPAHLAFIYPRWTIDAHVWWQYAFATAAVALAVALWALRGRTRAPFAVFIIFVATLGPALGFVNVFPFRYSFVADHFAYLAIAAPIVLAAAGVARVSTGRTALMTVTAIAAVVLGVLSFRQSGAYVDSETLYRATIAENPSCWLCENNLAVALLSSRPPRVMDAIVHARRAVTLRADYADAHGNLATGLERDGQWQAALNEYQRAEHGYADAPDDVRLGGVYHGIGRMLVQLGRPGDALPAYDAALRLQPASVDLRVNAGVAFGSAGQDERAEREFRAAIALDPNSAHAHSDLGAALMKQQRFDDAIRELNAAIALDAQNPDSRFNLGIASERVGDHTRAIAAFKAALALDPRCASCVAHLRALGR